MLPRGHAALWCLLATVHALPATQQHALSASGASAPWPAADADALHGHTNNSAGDVSSTAFMTVNGHRIGREPQQTRVFVPGKWCCAPPRRLA